jgi:hypothetical protein
MIIIKGLLAAALVSLGATAVYLGADASAAGASDAARCPNIGLATLFAPMRN